MASAALYAEPVTRLQEAIDLLAQEDLDLVPAASLSDDLRGLRSAIERMEAEFSRRLERCDRNQGYAPSGYCSAAGWLNDECRMTRSTAWERVRQARRLAELPATAAAFAAGDVNLAHVSVITRSAEQVGCEALRDAEPILLEAARRLDARQLRYVTAQLRHCLDPEGLNFKETPAANTDNPAVRTALDTASGLRAARVSPLPTCRLAWAPRYRFGPGPAGFVDMPGLGGGERSGVRPSPASLGSRAGQDGRHVTEGPSEVEHDAVSKGPGGRLLKRHYPCGLRDRRRLGLALPDQSDLGSEVP